MRAAAYRLKTPRGNPSVLHACTPERKKIACVMPELPDVVVYIEALEPQLVGQRLERIQLPARSCCGPSIRRSTTLHGRPRHAACAASASASCSSSQGDLFLVIHLMIAGRLRWRGAGAEAGHGSEDGPRHVRVRARHAVLHRGELEEARVDAAGARRGGARARSTRGGIEPLDATLEAVSPGADAREPHAQARAHRSAARSAASATPTRTRSCTRRGCRR